MSIPLRHPAPFIENEQAHPRAGSAVLVQLAPVHVPYTPPQRRRERHPFGLLIVVGLHVLLAAVLLTAKLNTAQVKVSQVAVKTLEPPPPPPVKPQDLPNPPRTPLHQAVAPIPDVIVDRPDTITVARQEAPAAAHAAPVAPPAKDENAGNDYARIPARPTRIDAGAAGCRPQYPHTAQRNLVTGITKLRFTVDAAGHVVGVEVLQPSGKLRENRAMDQAAIDALSQCPVTVGIDAMGNAVGGTVSVNYVWSIID
jgi:periplasmic protein TonB